MAKIFTIFAAKDGSGATTFAVNMACELQKKRNNRILIINLSAPRDIAITFGENGNIRTINDLHLVLKRGSVSLVEGLLSTRQKEIGIIERNGEDFDQSLYDYSLPELDRLYNFIIVDGGSILNEALVWGLKKGNFHCMVLSDDLYALAKAEQKIATLSTIFYPATRLNLILNKTDKGSTFFVPLIKKKIMADNLFQLEFSPKVYSSHFKGMPAFIEDPKEEYFKNLERVVSTLVDSKGEASFADLNWSGLFKKETGQNLPTQKMPIKPNDNGSLKQDILNQLLGQIDLREIQSSNLNREDVYVRVKDVALKIISTLVFPKFEQIDKNILLKEVLNEALGLGVIEEMIEDPSISEIMVNSCDKIYFEREGKIHLSEKRFINVEQIIKIIERIVSPIGRRIDEGSPMVDARLADGSRVNVIIPPLSLGGPIITIRKFPIERLDVEKLVERGSLNREMARFLMEAVRNRLNIMISGGTGSGKTTLLNILSSFIPEGERIITIEDAAELRLHQEHVVRLEARPPNIEGKGAITIRDLVKNALRMRPDRIVVGECRGGEALDMLQAMNTGHKGSLTTVHANSVRDSLARLETLVMFAEINLPSRVIREQIVSAIDLIIQLNRQSDGSRRITNISEVTGMEGDVITMQELFVFKQSGAMTGEKDSGEFISTGFRPRFYEKGS